MLKLIVVLFLISLQMTSCMFRRLKEDVEKLNESWEVYGEVTMPNSMEGQLIAVVYKQVETACKIEAFKVVDPALKLFMIFMDPGVYRFALIHDKNKNFIVEDDEPVYLHNRGHKLKFSDVKKRINLELTIPVGGVLPSNYPRDLNAAPASAKDPYFFAFGEPLNLDDSRFSSEAGKLGLWEPAHFLEKHGAGLYWLEPYDPNRIPVLFVSGIGGSAQEWKYFLERLDREKFQAWYWLYPSGMRISYLGHNLNRWIEEMARMYPFDRIHVVAHSMGGLVSREAVVQHLERAAENSDYPMLIKKFITISTPWNGHRMAKKGVKNVTVPVPSWHDVVPGSPFLQTVFSVPLKPTVDHHLLFGYCADDGSDGAVALTSVLLNEAQNDAVEVHGFEGDHVGILFKADVFEHVQDILYRFEEELTTTEKTPSTDTDEN